MPKKKQRTPNKGFGVIGAGRQIRKAALEAKTQRT